MFFHRRSNIQIFRAGFKPLAANVIFRRSAVNTALHNAQNSKCWYVSINLHKLKYTCIIISAKYYAVNLILTVFALVLFVAQKKLEEYAQNKNEMPGWMKRKILIGSPTTEQNIECEKMTKFARIFSVICLVLYSLVYFVSFVILIA